MTNELFFRLTPDWVLRAVEKGGFEPTGHCSALNSLENRVYDLMLEDETHVVAKFYRPGRWSKEAIEEEHQFLFDLREAEIPVATPFRFESGETVHEVEGIYYAVWPRVGGRAPDELNDEEVEILGRLLARMHNVGASRKVVHRRRLDANTYARQSLEFLDSRRFLPPAWQSRYRAAVSGIADAYEDRSRGVPLLRIHGDCHMGNLIRGREGWFFLDFDDHAEGPAVQDLWLLVASRDPETVTQRALLVEAYEQFRRFDRRWFKLVEPLRGLRMIHYAAWIARRSEDPAFKHAFPQFGTESYWEAQTLDLEDLLRVIEAEEG